MQKITFNRSKCEQTSKQYKKNYLKKNNTQRIRKRMYAINSQVFPNTQPVHSFNVNTLMKRCFSSSFLTLCLLRANERKKSTKR